MLIPQIEKMVIAYAEGTEALILTAFNYNSALVYYTAIKFNLSQNVVSSMFYTASSTNLYLSELV
jgi:hypothetical protein